MAIVKMQKISICASKKHRTAVLDFLQSMEAMEIRTETMTDPDLGRKDTHASRNAFEKNAESLEKAAEIVHNASPGKKEGMPLFSEKTVVSREKYESVVWQHDEVLGHALQVLRADRDIADCKAAISRCRTTQDMLQPWLKMGIPMHINGTKETTLLLGTMPGTLDAAQIEAYASVGGQLPKGSENEEDRFPENLPVSADVYSVVNDVTYLSVLTRTRYAEQVEANLREHGFSKPQQIIRGLPEESSAKMGREIRRLEERLNELKLRREKITEELRQCRQELPLIKDIRDNSLERANALEACEKERNEKER